LSVPDELVVDGRLEISAAKLPFLRRFTRSVLEHRGIDTTPLRRLLETQLDEDRIRNAAADFGIQTFNLSDMRPGGRFVEEIDSGNLVEYLLASSAVPGFVAPIIEGKRYVDGGVYDNVPYMMARSRGYRRIIAVDIAGVGVTRKPDIRGAETVYIKTSMELGGVLDFNRKTLNELKRLGYLDTMRTFGRLHGYRYFIEPNLEYESDFLGFLQSDEGLLELVSFLDEHGFELDEVSPYDIRLLFPREMRHEKSLLLSLLDCAAGFLDLPRIERYTYDDLYDAIRSKVADVDAGIRAELETAGERHAAKVSKGVESAIRAALKRSEHEMPHYYYFKILDYVLRDKAKSVLKSRLSGFFPLAQPSEFLLTIMDKLDHTRDSRSGRSSKSRSRSGDPSSKKAKSR
jgi:NTE family protein